MSLKFITPVAINDATLISSTRAENDYAAWAVGTTYALGARVIKASTHRIYESVQAGNLGHDPATDTSGAWWVDVGPTNRWAMFDKTVGSITSQATPLTVVLEPGIVTALALLDIAGTQVTVSMTDGVAGPTVYNKTFDISDDAPLIDWWGYFFDLITPATQLIVTDLPPYGTGRLTVSIAAAATASCGTLAVGGVIEVGDVRLGARLGIIDYSKKTTDDYGVTSVVQRPYAKRFDLNALIKNTHLDYIANRLAAIRATPVVWIASDRFDSLAAFGWVRDWGITIAYQTRSEIAVSIEGLT